MNFDAREKKRGVHALPLVSIDANVNMLNFTAPFQKIMLTGQRRGRGGGGGPFRQKARPDEGPGHNARWTAMHGNGDL